MNAIPGNIAYFNANGALQVLIQFQVSPNKEYIVQGTTDAITYTDLYTFTAVPNQQFYSWSLTPTSGALWPRLIQK